jgi:diguanylate cyclase (GGDEF)-like protein
MNLKRHLEDRSVSSLTGLPGSSGIDEEIRKRVIDGSRKFSVLFVDVDNFKAFNHAYGFLRGDEVIKLVGEIAAEAVSGLGDHTDFLGHDGGDDFVLVTSPERSSAIASRIIDEFDQKISDFYGLDDLTRGFVVTQTRQGAVLKHPIMTVSVSVISNEKRRIATHWEVREIGREIKEYAKSFTGSGYYPDRRAK